MHSGFRWLWRHVEPQRGEDAQGRVFLRHDEVGVFEQIDGFSLVSDAPVLQPATEKAVIVVVGNLNGTATEVTSLGKKWGWRKTVEGCVKGVKNDSRQNGAIVK